MRPLKLTMQGFGPYAGKEMIDFTILGNRTMFVISGKTGSGKTTIFDGISYAIYGKASGEDRNGPELRSQFASNSLLTEVQLEFKLRNQRYLIIRSPQQEKKKERGDGFTTIGAKAELFAFDENGEKKVIASSIRDVDEKIKEIMQIDSNQFRQILMIPQGEFRKLLTSDSKEKESILQRLFHTEMYKRIEEKLKVHASGLKKSVEQQLYMRHTALQNIKSVYIEELQSYMEEKSDNDVVILPLLEKEIAEMEKELGNLKRTMDEKSKNRDKVRQQLFESEAILKQMQLRDSLGAKKQALSAKQEYYKQQEQAVQLAQKAVLLTQQEEICHHLKKQIDNGEKEKTALNEWKKKESARWKEAEECFKKEENKEAERKKISEHLSFLKSIEKDVKLFSKKERIAAETQRSLTCAEAQKKGLFSKKGETEEILQKRKAEKQQLETAKITYLENKEKLITLQYMVEKTTKYKEENKKIVQLNTQIADRLKRKTNIIERYKDAVKLIEKMESDWLSSQSYILAETLRQGEACPVCGSTEHPHLANNKAVHSMNEEDVKSAREDLVKIEKEKIEEESILMQLQTKQSFLQDNQNALLVEIKKFVPDYTAENAEEMNRIKLMEVEELKKHQVYLVEAEKQRTKTNEEIVIIEQQLQDLQVKGESISADIQSMSIQLAEQTTTLNSIKTLIPEELRDEALYKQACETASFQLQKLEEAYNRAQTNLQESKDSLHTVTIKKEDIEKRITELNETMKEERTIFLENMKEQGFSNYSSYMQAKQTEDEMKERQLNIQKYREEYRSVQDRYQDLVDSLQDIQEPDISLLKANLAEIELEIEHIQQKQTNLIVKKRDNEEAYNKVLAINMEIKQLEEEYKLLGHLYDISRGQNTYRITFERYVLAAFLDEILEEANKRLIKMTSGRYQLLRKSDRSKGNVQSGLELLVFDQYTGQERHVKTLSGGESFKAALSLALGLADVVQQYAGGVSLETMFIDEGFGTLDPESLDQAIETLMEIQSSGRLVGIISHVPEIKERMEIRLEVIAGQTGSTTEFHSLH
ncbi:MAG: SbcC/MukB-like Walker B domain-containing protein [Bacillus sp. (in: firmicutes)]